MALCVRNPARVFNAQGFGASRFYTTPVAFRSKLSLLHVFVQSCLFRDGSGCFLATNETLTTSLKNTFATNTAFDAPVCGFVTPRLDLVCHIC